VLRTSCRKSTPSLLCIASGTRACTLCVEWPSSLAVAFFLGCVLLTAHTHTHTHTHTGSWLGLHYTKTWNQKRRTLSLKSTVLLLDQHCGLSRLLPFVPIPHLPIRLFTRLCDLFSGTALSSTRKRNLLAFLANRCMLSPRIRPARRKTSSTPPISTRWGTDGPKSHPTEVTRSALLPPMDTATRSRPQWQTLGRRV
jgi:hypothetical protein